MPLNWSGFLTALGLVFVAELGDKTQLTVMTQVCKYRRPWPVFAGASLALALVTVLGAVAGQALSHLVPQDVVRVVAAGGFLVLGVLMARQALNASPETPSLPACENPDTETLTSTQGRWCWRAFWATLVLLFVAEMGDKTQLAIISLTGQQGSVWPVLLGGTLALTGVTALGVLGGEALSRIIPQQKLLWISAGMFVVVAVLIAWGAL